MPSLKINQGVNNLLDYAFVVFQYLLPKRFLCGLISKITQTRVLWLKNTMIKVFIRYFDVDMSIAKDPDPAAYRHFNDFFTRAIQTDTRPWPTGYQRIGSPVDGTISQVGVIEDNLLFQAKGHRYALEQLLGESTPEVQNFSGGNFLTVYLSPRDYHRIHMPLSGQLIRTRFIPGQLFSVNAATERSIPNLFARNERLITYFETEAGIMALILVGAIFVSAIETIWSKGIIQSTDGGPLEDSFDKVPTGITLGQGDEMGRFNMGSTIILLFGRNRISWESGLKASLPIKMGNLIGNIKPPPDSGSWPTDH